MEPRPNDEVYIFSDDYSIIMVAIGIEIEIH